MIGLVSKAPYQVIWNNAPLGPHEVMAKVFDEDGLTAESSRITVTVEAAPVENQAPSISITAPSNNQSYTEGEEVVIKADASDPEDEISKVECTTSKSGPNSSNISYFLLGFFSSPCRNLSNRLPWRNRLAWAYTKNRPGHRT